MYGRPKVNIETIIEFLKRHESGDISVSSLGEKQQMLGAFGGINLDIYTKNSANQIGDATRKEIVALRRTVNEAMLNLMVREKIDFKAAIDALEKLKKIEDSQSVAPERALSETDSVSKVASSTSNSNSLSFSSSPNATSVSSSSVASNKNSKEENQLNLKAILALSNSVANTSLSFQKTVLSIGETSSIVASSSGLNLTSSAESISDLALCEEVAPLELQPSRITDPVGFPSLSSLGSMDSTNRVIFTNQSSFSPGTSSLLSSQRISQVLTTQQSTISTAVFVSQQSDQERLEHYERNINAVSSHVPSAFLPQSSQNTLPATTKKKAKKKEPYPRFAKTIIVFALAANVISLGLTVFIAKLIADKTDKKTVKQDAEFYTNDNEAFDLYATGKTYKFFKRNCPTSLKGCFNRLFQPLAFSLTGYREDLLKEPNAQTARSIVGENTQEDLPWPKTCRSGSST